MKAITTITLMAMLMASVNADDFDGGVYDSGYAVFSGGKGLAITSNGLIVDNGILKQTPNGCYSSCGDVYYGGNEIVTKTGYFYYGSNGTKVQVGEYYSGTAGSTYVFENDPE
jgi:hypothetical protein